MSASRASIETYLFEGDLGRSGPNLALLLTRLQKSLKREGAESPLLIRSGQLSLDRSKVWSDVAQFEDLLEKARTQYDPLIKGSTLAEALKLVSGRPIPELDHSLLVHEKTRIEKLVFSAMADLASGPLGPQNQALILGILQYFNEDCYTDPILFEKILLIYGGLGLKENLVSSFTRYESALYDEFGESPRSQITTLFHELLLKLDAGSKPQAAHAPPRPRAMIGRDDEVRILSDFLRQKTYEIITIVGQSGIGKSHLLRTLFWLMSGESFYQYFDLENVSISAVPEFLKGVKCEGVFLDHFTSDSIELVEQLRKTFPEMAIVIAGHVATKLPGEGVMLLAQLDAGTPGEPGASAELILSQFAAIKSTGGSPELEKVIELAELCGGLPLALEVAGRLAATIGLEGTIGSLKRNPLGLPAGPSSLVRHRSLDQSILSSFVHLSPGAKRVVHGLSLIGEPCHVDLLLSALKVAPDDLEEAILSGLVLADRDRPILTLMRLTQDVVRTHEAELGLAPDVFMTFCKNSIDWFTSRLEDKTEAVRIAYCLPIGISVARYLANSGDRSSGCVLFGRLRPWFGSCKIPESVLRECSDLFQDRGDESRSDWVQCLLTVGAALFHGSLFEEMRINAERIRVSEEFGLCTPGEQCHVEMQLALASRALGQYEVAIQGYRQVLERAREVGQDSIVVTVCYNLGSLLETRCQFAEAYQYFEEGSKFIDETTDPRLESSIHLAIGRLLLRLGNDPKEAEMILDAALFHARGRKDSRMIVEIMSVLSIAYLKQERFDLAATASVTAMMLRQKQESEYEFLRQALSGLLIQCLAFFGLGFEELAVMSRVLQDRAISSIESAMHEEMKERVESLTYVTPPGIKRRPLTEVEARHYIETAFATLMDSFGDQAKISSLMNYALEVDSAWSRTMKANPNWSWKTNRPSSVASHSQS